MAHVDAGSACVDIRQSLKTDVLVFKRSLLEQLEEGNWVGTN